MGVALVIALLEVSGLWADQRLEESMRVSLAWARESALSLELDGLAVRAAGEAVSAYLTGSDAYGEEAKEAIGEARERLQQLVEADHAHPDETGLRMQLREYQDRVLSRLEVAIAPLGQQGEVELVAPLMRAEAVYAYESDLKRLRDLADRLETAMEQQIGSDVERWRTVANVLAIARLMALIAMVLALGSLLQRRLITPLTELAEAATRVSCGDFDTKVREVGDSDLASLQRAFNGMTERLNAYCDEAREREVSLRAALDEAEAASAAKSTFVASVSHELRTPMHGVLGTADMLLRSPLDDATRRGVMTIRASSESLLTIINDVLDLSRLEAGRMEIQFGPVCLRTLLAECIALVESRAMQRGLRLTSQVADGLPEWFLGDSGRLQQILMNLLGNATKFTEQGEISLRVSACGRRTDWLSFEVADTGCGIPEAALRRIFEPFEQADGSIARRHGGTGLGLAISSRLAEAMGGSLSARNRADGGAAFRLEMPATHCSPPELVARSVGLAEGEFTGHVLVVEDHPVNQTLAEAMLAELGCTCEIVGDGAAAIGSVEARHYDLVLMDCQMPVVDGFSATRAIRVAEAGGRERHTIVAMTAGAMQHDREAALEAGMDDFLAKPFTVDQMREVLSHWLPVRA
ncbi:MAG: response regulator [Rhodocyclaceae bacterium]|nr:response regulator [Rhodocyclaceae bacterium]